MENNGLYQGFIGFMLGMLLKGSVMSYQEKHAQPQVPKGFTSIYGNGIILPEKDGTSQAYTTTNGVDYVKMDKAFLEGLRNTTTNLETKTLEAKK
jgi:hypothetical protein